MTLAFNFPPPQTSALRPGEIAVDLFAGGGGASEGLKQALGIDPALAYNHDPAAIGMHAANHPLTQHHREDIWHADPRVDVAGRPVGWFHASPDCTHFSQAKGGQPRPPHLTGRKFCCIVPPSQSILRPGLESRIARRTSAHLPMPAFFSCRHTAGGACQPVQWRAVRGGRKARRSVCRYSNRVPSATPFGIGAADSLHTEIAMTRNAQKAATPRAVASSPLHEAIRGAAPELSAAAIARVAEIALAASNSTPAANAAARTPTADELAYFSSRNGQAYLVESLADAKRKLIEDMQWLLCSIGEAKGIGEDTQHLSALVHIGMEWLSREADQDREFRPQVDAAVAAVRAERGVAA